VDRFIQTKTKMISGPFYTIVEYISPAEMLRFCNIFGLSENAACRSGHLAMHLAVSTVS